MLRHHLLVILFAGVFALSVRAGNSNSLLDVSPDGKFLLAANVDNGTVSVVDTQARKLRREIKVGEKPEGVAWIGESSLAAATAYKDSQVILFNPQTGDIAARIRVAAEPYGIVADKAGKRAWVTHEYPGTISEIDVDGRKVTREIKAGSFLRGI